MSNSDIQKLYSVELGYTRPVLAEYPVLTTGGKVQGVLLTPGAGAWPAGYTDIINPAGGGAPVIAVPFWLLQVLFDTIAAAPTLKEVQIYNLTTTTMVYECRVDSTAVTPNLGPYKIPIPVFCAALNNIQARCGAAAAQTIRASLLVATGL